MSACRQLFQLLGPQIQKVERGTAQSWAPDVDYVGFVGLAAIMVAVTVAADECLPVALDQLYAARWRLGSIRVQLLVTAGMNPHR